MRDEVRRNLGINLPPTAAQKIQAIIASAEWLDALLTEFVRTTEEAASDERALAALLANAGFYPENLNDECLTLSGAAWDAIEDQHLAASGEMVPLAVRQRIAWNFLLTNESN